MEIVKTAIPDVSILIPGVFKDERGFFKATDYYHPEAERPLLWNDESLCIDWPIDPSMQIVLSHKDWRGASLSLAGTCP